MKKFLDYLISKESTSATDKMVYVFTVHNPSAYELAGKYVFHEKNSQPGSEALARLKEFVAEHQEMFGLPQQGYIELEEVDYEKVFEVLFL
ncbi:MAG: hypothetical protein ACOCVN_01175 [bacterium]